MRPDPDELAAAPAARVFELVDVTITHPLLTTIVELRASYVHCIGKMCG
jgi:hypothetical protein